MSRAVLALLAWSSVAAAAPRTYALVIGNNAPPPADSGGLAQLAYADDDAARYQELLGRFADEVEVLAVLDAATERRFPTLARRVKPPTVAELTAAVQRLSARAGAAMAAGDEVTFFFVFSGHGARKPSGDGFFLALLDGELDRRRLSDDVLAKVPATWAHLIVDACHAEAVVGVRGAGARELDAPLAPVTQAELERLVVTPVLAQRPNAGAVVAAAADQEAHEWSRIQSGVFSHVVLSGLSGAADANSDGAVEYSELAAFIAAAHAEVPDARAIPRVIAVAPRAGPHVPLVRLQSMRHAAFLEGSSRSGHFFVEAENGVRLVEANLSPELRTRIALPAGDAFLISESGQQEALVRARPGERIAFDALEHRPRSSVARGGLDSSLRAGLFSAAYGAAYYRGFVDSRGLARATFLEPSIERDAAPAPGWRRPLGVAALSAAALAGGASIAFGVLALRERDLATGTPLQREAREALQRFETDRALAISMAAAAAALGVAGVLVWPREGSTTLAISAGASGISFAGAW